MLANWVKLSRAHVLSRFDYSGFARARDGNASGQSLTSTDGSKGEMIGSDIVMTEIIPRPDRRPCTVPEVGMTDVYFGDLSKIPGDMLDHINEVTRPPHSRRAS